jgi:hypothetical protein
VAGYRVNRNINNNGNETNTREEHKEAEKNIAVEVVYIKREFLIISSDLQTALSAETRLAK